MKIDPHSIKQSLKPLASQLPSSKPVELPPKTIDDYRERIGVLWTDAQQTFLKIGDLLNRAKSALDPADFVKLCDQLPFGKSARSQLMSACRAITAGELPAGCERAGYGAVYLCTTLTPDERQTAIAQGVIGPSMRQSDLARFRATLRMAPTAPPPYVRLAQIEAEIARLEEQLTALRAERESLRSGHAPQ